MSSLTATARAAAAAPVRSWLSISESPDPGDPIRRRHHAQECAAGSRLLGGPEALSVIDEPTGEPGPGEARIEVRAAGVNPVDYKVYSGAFGTDPAQLPIRLGSEAAGVVTAVGPGAVGPAGQIAAGDEVI